MYPRLREGALFISDAHFSQRRPKLLAFLKALYAQEIDASQLILMGDIFDLLFAPIGVTCKRNAEVIALINAISNLMEVIYFEGNHDFQIASLFPNIEVIPLSAQPKAFEYHGKRVMLAHGDYGSRLSYRIYTALIRSKVILHVLGLINTITSNGIVNKLDVHLQRKDDCKRIEGFEALIARRLENLNLEDVAYFIEGHFHQNRHFDVGALHYFNLGAFACNERYYVVKSNPYAVELEEFTYH